MGRIHPRADGLKLIRDRKARAEGLVYDDGRQKTYMALTNYATQSVEHYYVGDGDLRETPAGQAAMDESRPPIGRPPLPPEAKSDAKPRSIRLGDAHWSKLQTLGRAWLERQIDRATV